MPFATTWMDIEMITLSEVSHKEKSNIFMMWNPEKWSKRINLPSRNRDTDVENESIDTKVGDEINWEIGIDIYMCVRVCVCVCVCVCVYI